MENIPSFIADLLQRKAFEQLSESEQGEVLKHLSREDYIDLYRAAEAATSFTRIENISVNASHKEDLLKRFQQKHQRVSPLQLMLNKPVQVWKVACMILMLGGAGILFMLQVKKGASQVQYITQLDTLYLEKELPVKVYDTVYLTREVEKPSTTSAHPEYRSPKHNRKEETGQQLPPEDYSGINMISIQEKDRPLNNKKGSNIKDDSLINTYGFTRL
jgi:hypothetical protein